VKQPSPAVKYGLFALLATAVNIALQRALGTLLREPRCIYLAILAGTAGGLAVKYCLDRRFVFRYRPPSRSDETLRVLLYLVMSAFATAVFWAVELCFWALFSFPAARYAGGALGLALGYALKYELDRRFVFPGCRGKAVERRGRPCTQQLF
jgi:putative flippase GtrA